MSFICSSPKCWPLPWLGEPKVTCPGRAFAKAISPAQAVALSTRSSLASLPALIDVAETRLKLPTATSAFVLPLAVATFKMSTPITHLAGALFLSRLYGVPLAGVQIVTIAARSLHEPFPELVRGPVLQEWARRLGVVFDAQPAWLHLDGDAIKGVFGPERMRDFLPQDVRRREYVIAVVEDVYRTDEDGRVTIESDGERFSVRTER